MCENWKKKVLITTNKTIFYSSRVVLQGAFRQMLTTVVSFQKVSERHILIQSFDTLAEWEMVFIYSFLDTMFYYVL